MTRLTPYRITSLTAFRQSTAEGMHWVHGQGNRLWITRYGRAVAALVPMHQCEQLEIWETRSLREERARLEDQYRRWKRLKGQGEEPALFNWDLRDQLRE